MPKNKDPLETRRRFSMGLQLKSIKRRLEKYGNDPRIKGKEDEYIKGQLEKHNRVGYYYPGIAKDIMSGTVTSGEAIRSNPTWRAEMAKPENQALYNLMKEKKGEPFVTKESTLRPDQEAYAKHMVELATQKADQIYPKIGQPTALEQPVNDMMMKMLEQYQQQHLGRNYLGGGLENTFPGLKENLSALGSGAYNAGSALGRGAQETGDILYRKGQNAYGALNPYLQGAAAKGQSYLSAAQPYAQKAADLGGGILNAIRAPAVSAAQQYKQEGLSGLLNMLKGRA
jgi:hypothetical protein